MTPLYGRLFQCERVYDTRPTNLGKRVNTVAVLSKDGIMGQYSYMDSLNAKKLFISYLGTFVLPCMCDGQTLIMNNHPVHRAEAEKDYLNKNEINFLYLPHYSPDLNPIEDAFSKIKQYIKKQKARTVDTLLNVIKDALAIITPNDANGYFNHAA